jgi:hypothetical protein
MTIDARGAIWRGNNQERRENLCAPPSVWLYGFNLIWSYVLVIRLSTVICRRVLEERTPLGGGKTTWVSCCEKAVTWRRWGLLDKTDVARASLKIIKKAGKVFG